MSTVSNKRKKGEHLPAMSSLNNSKVYAAIEESTVETPREDSEKVILPKGWRWAPLEELSRVVRGGSPRPAGDPRYFGGTIPWITVGPITADSSAYLRSVPSTITELGKERSRYVEVGTLLLTNSGATLGVPKITLIGGCINDGVAALLDVPEDLKLYLLYFLQTQTLRLRNVNQGAAQPNLNTSIIKAINVPVAPASTRHRIVAEIEKQFTRLDAGVAALKRAQANLKRYRAAVLKAACEGKLVPTEAELAKAAKVKAKFETGEQLLARILNERRKNWQGRGKYTEPVAPKAADLGPLPEGWAWASIEHVSNVVRGSSPRPAGDPRYFGGNVPWITVGPITADKSDYLKMVPETLNEVGREHSRYIEPHTLLLTNSGATLGVPKISLIGGCINDGVAALLDVDYPLKLYLLYFLRTQTESLRNVNQGAAQPNLNTSIIKSVAISLPPLPEQTRIVAEVERRLSVVDELDAMVTANLQRAARLRQSILQKAFEGRL